jgi:hypothetical protein
MTPPWTGFALWAEWRTVSAAFLFGDSDRTWQDPQRAAWPAQPHTGVGFIPTGVVLDVPVPTVANVPMPSPFEPVGATSGVALNANAFGTSKGFCAVTPPFAWGWDQIVSTTWWEERYGWLEELQYYDARAQWAIRPVTDYLPFLTNIRFKRDYIGEEAIEIQKRGLTPPEHEILMVTE